MNRVGVFAGSFCPPTKGHLQAIIRASQLVDKLIVVIGVNVKKNYAISAEDRLSLLSELTSDIGNVEVVLHNGMLCDYCTQNDVNVMFKSVRNVTEMQEVIDLADYNSEHWQGETVFLVASKEQRHISSSMIRELIAFGQPIEQYVPDSICQDINSLLGGKK